MTKLKKINDLDYAKSIHLLSLSLQIAKCMDCENKILSKIPNICGQKPPEWAGIVKAKQEIGRQVSLGKSQVSATGKRDRLGLPLINLTTY